MLSSNCPTERSPYFGEFRYAIRVKDDYEDFASHCGVFEKGVIDISSMQLYDSADTDGKFFDGHVDVYQGNTDALVARYAGHPRTDGVEIELDQRQFAALEKFCEASLDRELLVTAGMFLWSLGQEAFFSDFEWTRDSEFIFGPTTDSILISKTSNLWKTCTLEEILEIDLEIHDRRIGERMDRLKTFQGGEYWDAMLVHVYDHYHPCDENTDWNQVYVTYAKPIVDKVKADSQFLEHLEELYGEDEWLME